MEGVHKQQSRVKWEMHIAFYSEEMKRKDPLWDLGADGRIVIKRMLEKQGLEGVYWIQLVGVRIQLQAVVNAVIKFRAL
jgi:hypothetical protein